MSEATPKTAAMRFATETGDDGQRYVPVSRIVEPDGQREGVAWAGYPVPLRDGPGRLPVAFCALLANASPAGRARGDAVAKATQGIADSRETKPFPLGDALGLAGDIVKAAFANYSPETIENEILPRVDIASASLIAGAVMSGNAPEVRVAKTSAPASPTTKSAAGAS